MPERGKGLLGMDSNASRTDLSALLDHSEWLHALARRLVGDPGAADDLVQETWVAALRNPPDVTRPARPWLAGVLRKLVLLRRRSEGRRAGRQESVAREEGLPSAAEMVESVDTGRRLAGLVLELAEPYRTTVLLRYWHDLSSAEIARRQGIPEGTVRWRLKHGMDELRERLDGAFGERRSWHHALVAMLSVRGLVQNETLVTSGGGTAALVGGLVLGIAAVWGAREYVNESSAEPGHESFASIAADISAHGMGNEPAGEHAAAGSIEREVSAVPAARPDTRFDRVVRVLDASDQPVRDALVVLDDGTRAGVAVHSDPDGRALFSAVEGSATLYVRAAGTYLVSQELGSDDLEASVRLPAGAELSGRLATGGLEPAAGVRLALAIDHPLFEGPIPAAVEAHFGTARRAIAFTGPDGSFCFRGLDPWWKGTLELPKTWRLADEPAPPFGGPRLRYEHPERGLTIEVERRPHLCGTVFTSGSIPAIQARVELEVAWPDGTTSRIRDRADEEGRFVLLIEDERFARHDPHAARLSAIARDGLVSGLRILEQAELVDGADLAPLVLDTPLTSQLTEDALNEEAASFASGEMLDTASLRLEILVTDELGRPLVGAVVERVGEVGRELRSRSDANGALVLDALEAGPIDLLISRPGYAARLFRTALAAQLRSTTVALERGHDLELEVVDESGVHLDGLAIEGRTADSLPVWKATPRGGGGYGLSGLGSDPLSLEIRREDRIQTIGVDPLAERLRITLR